MGQHSAGRFHATTGLTGSGLKTDLGEDQVGPSALATVVSQCSAGVGWHSAGRFHATTGLTGSGLKTDPGEDQLDLQPCYSFLAISSCRLLHCCQPGPAHYCQPPRRASDIINPLLYTSATACQVVFYKPPAGTPLAGQLPAVA